jgi:hypothetical protein
METVKQPYFFDQKGIILSGEHPGWTVEIIDDTKETGGYYVFYYDPSPQATEGYDEWFESESWIPHFIEDMNWRIQWPEADSTEN